MSFWSKRIKNKKELADALNVDESKIDALVNNELEIGGNTMNKVLETIEEERINKAIRDNDIWKWIQETDFRQKRLEFGYKTIKEVASNIGVSDSTISRLEVDKSVYPKLTPTLKKVYEFYQNDFNKNTTNITTKQNIDRSKKINKENKDIWKWYNNNDIRLLRQQKGFRTAYDFAKTLGVCSSCISDLERKSMKRVNQTMLKAYNFLNNMQMPIEENKDSIYEWYKSIEDLREYRRKFGYSLNKFMSELNLSYDQARTFERHEYKSATAVVKRVYNFYHDESKRLPAIEWEPTENNAFVIHQDELLPIEPIVDACENTKNDEISILEARIKQLESKNEQLEKQLARYEKLIDRI